MSIVPEERIPLLAQPQGGVAERSRKYREASAVREAGVVFRWIEKGKPPRLRLLRRLREIFLMTQPPLLAVMEGGDFRSLQTYGMSKLGGAVYNRPYSYEKRTHFAVDVGWLRIDRRASSLVLAPLNSPSGKRRYFMICA